MAQLNGPRGPERVDVMQRSAQNLLVEEGDGVERLVLRAGGDVSCEGQLGQKSFEFLLAGQGGRCALEGADVAPQPVNVGLPGRQGLVLAAYDFPHFPDRFGGLHNMLRVNGLRSFLTPFQYTNRQSHNQR